MALEGEDMNIVLLWIAIACYVLMFVFMFISFYELITKKNLVMAEKAWKTGVAMSIVAGIAFTLWGAMQ